MAISSQSAPSNRKFKHPQNCHGSLRLQCWTTIHCSQDCFLCCFPWLEEGRIFLQPNSIAKAALQPPITITYQLIKTLNDKQNNSSMQKQQQPVQVLPLRSWLLKQLLHSLQSQRTQSQNREISPCLSRR